MTDETTPSAFDICNAAALRRAARRVSQFYDAKLAPCGLRAAQWAILRSVVKAGGELSVKQLATLLELDRTTTATNLTPLERDGLVTVTRSPSDRRSRLVRPTPAGLEALAAARILWREAQADFEKFNGAEAATALRRTLADIRLEA
jgi:DNA-binding MarR family transcriptional regulator